MTLTAAELERKVEQIFKNLSGLLSHKSDAYGWILELAEIWNKTQKCERCNGRGYHAKHRECYHSTYDSYIRGCHEDVKCRKCHGAGMLLKTTVTQRHNITKE